MAIPHSEARANTYSGGLYVTIFFCQRYTEQKKDFHYYPYCNSFGYLQE